MSRRKTKDITKEIASVFIPYVKGILIEGSFTWSNIEVPHDIDLELITPSFEFFRVLKPKAISVSELSKAIKNFTDKTLNHVLALNLGMFSLKIFPNSQEISLRFTKASLFKKACCLKLERARRTISVFQYRLYPTTPLDVQRNFAGKRIKYKRWHFSLGKRQIIESPLIIVDSQTKLYPGSVLDRYLAFPKIIYESKTFCQKNLRKLKINLVKRLILEERQSIHDVKPSLSLCLCKREKMATRLLRQLEKEEKKIKLQLTNEK